MDYLLMCIGNKSSGDDAIGPYIAESIKRIKKGITVIDCGMLPENYTSVVKKYKPENLVIIDAVDMGLKPGEIRLVPKEKIGMMHISTHGIPISVLIKYLEVFVKSIIFIGIQPKKMIGSLSRSVKLSGNKLIKNIINKNFNSIEKLQ
jgi:hydrogenase 3 maturation protease